MTFQKMPKQKYTKQNQIYTVKYFCSKVSGPSEMPPFVRELIFKVVNSLVVNCSGKFHLGGKK